VRAFSDTSRFFLFLIPPVEYRGGASAWDVHVSSLVDCRLVDDHEFSEISLEISEICEETLLRVRINVASEKISFLASAVYK